MERRTVTPDPIFTTANLARTVEALSPNAIDQLPFGTIKLSPTGVVQLYSRREVELSGNRGTPPLGLAFFTELAPCMNTPKVKGRIDAAIASGKLDAEFTHIGDFSDREREITIRAQSASDGGVWLFLKREDS
jgi:photoactive yellow protein